MQRRAYTVLLRRKREAFWASKVESECSSPRQLWRSIDALMGRGRVPPSEVIGAAEFRRYFDAKVADVRALTDSAPPPSFSSAPSGCTFVIASNRRQHQLPQVALRVGTDHVLPTIPHFAT